MFAKTIIDSDAFLDMPATTQVLYFHLAMRADDDGFINNPKRIQRAIGGNDDDLKLLIAKNFIIPFEVGIVVIKHWRIHNYIQKDRYKPTVYLGEKQRLEVKQNGAYRALDTGCIHDVSILDSQVRLGKVRQGKDRILLSSKVFADDSLEYGLSVQLKTSILKNNPNAKTPDDLQKWAYEFDKMVRLDNRAPQNIQKVIDFSQRDSFWMANILSARALREKFDTLTMQANSKRTGKADTRQILDKYLQGDD